MFKEIKDKTENFRKELETMKKKQTKTPELKNIITELRSHG